MTTKQRTVWAIWGFPVGFRDAGGFIATSVGFPYAELRTIARRMNSNGGGQRYEVRRYWAAENKPAAQI